MRASTALAIAYPVSGMAIGGGIAATFFGGVPAVGLVAAVVTSVFVMIAKFKMDGWRCRIR